MKKKTIKKFLLWTTGTLVIFAIGAYFVFDYATNYVLRTIVAYGTDKPIGSAIEPSSSQTKEATETANVPEEKRERHSSEPVIPQQQNQPPQNMVSGQIGPKDSPANDGPKESSNETTGATKPTIPATPPSNSSPGAASPPKPQTEANITTEQAQKAKEEITLKDKTKVTSVLLSKLSASDIKLFMKMSESGVSAEEKLEAKKIILQKLSEDEYNELIAIAAKLGLSSSGMNYQDSQKQVANVP